MELKTIMILMAVVLTSFVLISIPYGQVTENITIEGANSLSLSNSTQYEAKLDNIEEDAKNNFQDTKNVGAGEQSVFDKVGALIQSGFTVASKSVETAEDSTQLVQDVQNDTSSIIPAVVFTLLMSVIFLILLFGLIKIITGR